MDYKDESFSCSCGKDHSLPVKTIVVQRGALAEVGRVLSDLEARRVAVVGDPNTFAAAGEQLVRLLARDGYAPRTVEFEARRPVPDPQAVFKILEGIRPGEVLVACGSGTITDLVRFVSSRREHPFLAVATAPSMDGYTSNMAPMTVRGVKKTYTASAPHAVICDLDVLKKAPWPMIQAGFGDLLGKTTSLLDWKLGHILFDEYYCPEAAGRVREALEEIVASAHDLSARKPEAIRTLIEGLLASGLAMLMVGSSRPASGGEHHFSHYLDMCSLLHRQTVPLHGIKVGLGTSFMAGFYLRLADRDLCEHELNPPSRDERKRRIATGYGERSGPVLTTLDERWGKQELNDTLLQKRCEQVNALLLENRSLLARVRSLLNDVDLLGYFDTLPRDWVENALKYGFEIRNRFTVLTLLYRLGLLDEWSEKALKELKSRGDS